jgi:hypothetical protein
MVRRASTTRSRTVTHGRLDCAIGPQAGGQGDPVRVTGQLSATWQTDPLIRDVGAAVEVTWRIGGHYLSQGIATVHLPALRQHPAGLYDVPDVRVGGTAWAPETLRMHVVPFTGDGTYTGDAVLAMIDGVVGTSPQVVFDGTRTDSGWSPLFGACVALIRDDGRAGEIACPGAGSPATPWSGSATLEATWQVRS